MPRTPLENFNIPRTPPPRPGGNFFRIRAWSYYMNDLTIMIFILILNSLDMIRFYLKS